MSAPEIISKIRDAVEPILVRIEDTIPIPYLRYILAFIILVGISTYLMKLWEKIKPRQSLGNAKVKGQGASNLRRDAKNYEKAGNYVQAAECLKALGNPEKALMLYQKGNGYKQAGELLLQMGRKDEAIEMWAANGQHALAAGVLAKDKEFERAGQLYEIAKNNPLAAENYEKAANYAKAGETYMKSGFNAKAGKCFEKAGMNLQAAKAIEAYFIEQAPRLRESMGTEKESIIKNIAKKSGFYYEKADRLEEAVAIYIRGGWNGEAAKLLDSMGDKQRAAKLYQEAGMHMDAARLHEYSGDSREAASSKAEAYRSQGRFAEAAQLYAEAEDFQMAADLYAQADKHTEAADMLVKCGSYMDAASLYMQAGDKRHAAWAYEMARDFNTALRLYQELQDVDSTMRVMAASGKELDAAKILLKQKRLAEAYRILEKIPPENPDHREAATLMVKMQLSQNRYDAAISILQKAIQGEPIGAQTIDLYYSLATVFEQRGDYELAIEIFTKVMAENIAFKDASARQKNLKMKLSVTTPAVAPTPSGDKTMVLPTGQQAHGAMNNPRYKIEKELGRGGMGIVFKAIDTVLDRPVAYKILPPDLRNHPEIVKKFNQEATALAKLLHSNIVTVFDAGGIGGEYYFVMEFVEGKDLKQMIKEGTSYSIGEVLVIFKQMAEALKFAHSKNVIHRDIKTSNVMIQSDGTLKLMDFGLAKIMEGAVSERTAVSGTPYYMSPEQTIGENVNHQTDLYSLGVMMYELATGQVPFRTGDIGYHHLHTEPEPPTAVRAGIPPQLEAIILKAMRKKKEERYQSAQEILDDLNKIATA